MTGSIFGKRGMLFVLSGILMALLLVASGAFAATPEEIKARGKIVVLTAPGYFPFEMIDENGDIIGFDMDIGKAIADDLGVKMEIVSITWDGIIPALETEKGDLILGGMAITEERQKKILFSEPYFYAGLGLLLSEKYKDIKSWKDMDVKGVKIGVRLGQTSDFYSETFFKNAEIVKFTNDTATMAMAVADGKIDAAIHNTPWVLVYVKKNPKGLFAFVDEKHYEMPVGIGINQNSPELKKAVDATVKKIRETKYDELYKYWFVDMPWFKE
ncbi:MAG: transporter substrate-binding domain-containing protein [Synergistaceae bacterium]|nr:transporter substrate-binding domain-containing protein [Synergistaceae bacterium]